MSNLFNRVGSTGADQLLADPKGADVFAVPMEPGAGIVKRGTVIYRKASGLWAAAAAAECTTTNPLAILNEDVDTSADATVAEDAAAYRAGRFIATRVKLKADAALTAAVKQTLRLQNIVFDQADDAAEFDNKVSG